MIEVNVRELKSRMSHYLRRVEEGEQIKITRRGKTVGTIIPTLGRTEEETSAERAIRNRSSQRRAYACEVMGQQLPK